MSLNAALQLRRPGFSLDATLAAPPGQVTVLFGPSGCGKTTLLSAIAGLQRAGGRCALGDTVWQDDNAGTCLPTHKRGVGYVFQNARLFPHRDVRGNLDYAARRNGNRAALAETVERFGLEPLLARRPDGLSGGERQRVALARTLLARPRLLLLDEPLASLDTPRRRELLPQLESAARDARIPVVYVTHDLEELIRLGDRVQLMAAGRTLESGPVATILARTDVALATRDDASAVLVGELAGQDREYGLSVLRLQEQQLRLPAIARAINGRVRVRVQARDVSLALTRPVQTSLLNVLAGRVQEVVAENARHTMLVRVAVDGQMLLARISSLSAANLDVQPGLDLFVQIKAAALC